MAITKKLAQVKRFVCSAGKRDGCNSSALKKKDILGGTWRYSSAAGLNLRRKERGKDTKKGGKEKKTITKRKSKLNEISTMKVTERGRKISESPDISSTSNTIFTRFLQDYLLPVSFFGQKS